MPKPIIKAVPKYPVMSKRVILISGTPCTGKTSLAKHLTAKLNALNINLTDYAKANGLILSEDKQRQTSVINEKKMARSLTQTINASEKENIIIDGHYAQAVVSNTLATHVFVLRRNPKELKQFMTNCNFPEKKSTKTSQQKFWMLSLLKPCNFKKAKSAK